MGRGRGVTAKRVGVVAAGVLLAGLVATGVATAEDAPSPAPLPGIGNALSSLTTPGTSGSGSSTSTSGDSGAARLAPDLAGSSMSTGSGSTGSSTSSSTSSSSTGSSTQDGSNGTYTISFPPTLPPGSGSDGGHRYYGRYWDAAANCWRYASPGYVAPVVVASQVAAVPKGGVDTGDGSFR